MSNNLKPSIYVACLAAYNNGYLHGCWIDAIQNTVAIHDEIKKMLVGSPIAYSEEWAIHDYDDFAGVNIDEYTSIETVSLLAQFVEEYGNLGGKILHYYDNDIDEATSALKDHYHGEWGCEEEYAKYLFDELYLHDIPESIRFYIDYEKFSHDLFIGDYFSIYDGNKVHVLDSY